jgi:hypothetical protein
MQHGAVNSMAVASEADVSPASDEESSLAADVLRLLPSAVTVLDDTAVSS